MALIQCAKADLMLVVIVMLRLIEEDYIRWAMKMAIDHEFQDLKGLINVNHIDASDVELLNSSGDKKIGIILAYATKLQVTADSYTNLFLIDKNELYTDQRIIDLAEDIYFSVIYDNEIHEGLEEDFNSYLYEAMQILYYLCQLVIVGEPNPDHEFWDADWLNRIFEESWDNYLEAKEYEFRMMAQIMVDVRECQHALF